MPGLLAQLKGLFCFVQGPTPSLSARTIIQTSNTIPNPCSDVALDTSTSMLSYRTIHLAPLAVVIPRTKLLPYTSWNVRPTGGRNGSSVAITLYVGLADPIVFEVWPINGLCGLPQKWDEEGGRYLSNLIRLVSNRRCEKKIIR